jgi:hypothetical protein
MSRLTISSRKPPRAPRAARSPVHAEHRWHARHTGQDAMQSDRAEVGPAEPARSDRAARILPALDQVGIRQSGVPGQQHLRVQRQAQPRELTAVRVGFHDGVSPAYHQIVMDLSSPPAGLPDVRSAGDHRYYVDLPETKLNAALADRANQVQEYAQGGLTGVRYAQNDETTVRVVAIAKEGATVSDEAGWGDEDSIYFRVFAPAAPQAQGDATTSTATDEPAVTPSRVAGDAGSKKVLRIALTIDDGPSEQTGNLVTQLGDLKATWYVQYERCLQSPRASFDLLQQIQSQGGEIAIHSFHPTANHAVWFPMHGPSGSYEFPYAGKSQSHIMNDSKEGLQGFYDKLVAEGITPRFVRLPGGLVSELTLYAQEKGIARAEQFARDLIAGKNIDSHGDAGKAIADDFATLKQKLSALNLLLWGGTDKPFEILTQSWNAESQPGDSKDNPDHILKGRKFENAVDRLAKQTGPATAPLVILSHDTSLGYVRELMGNRTAAQGTNARKGDLQRMDEYARAQAVRLEYYTMSQLFQLTTGKDPATLDVQY